MEENYKATSRNGHELKDMYTSVRDNELYLNDSIGESVPL